MIVNSYDQYIFRKQNCKREIKLSLINEERSQENKRGNVFKVLYFYIFIFYICKPMNFQMETIKIMKVIQGGYFLLKNQFKYLEL